MYRIIYTLLVVTYAIEWLAGAAGTGVSSSLGLLPKMTVLIIEIIDLFLLITLLPLINKEKSLMKIIYVAAILSALTAVWSIYNDASPMNVMLGFRLYLRPIPLFFAGYFVAKYDRESIHKYLRLLFIIACLQIPLSVYQYIFNTGQIGNKGTPFDQVAGSFGGLAGGVVGIFLMGASVFIFSRYYVEGGKVSLLLWIPFLLIQPVMGEVKVAVFIIIIVPIAFLFIGERKFKISRLVGIAVVPLIFLFTYQVAYEYAIDEGRAEKLQGRLLPSAIFQTEHLIAGRLSRAMAIANATLVVSKKPETLIFGFGAGNAIKNVVWGVNGRYYSSLTDRSLANRMIFELGLVGVALLAIIIWRLIRIAKYVYSKSDEYKYIALGFYLVIFIVILSIGYSDALTRAQIAFPFWLLAGFIIRLYHEHKLELNGGNEHLKIS